MNKHVNIWSKDEVWDSKRWLDKEDSTLCLRKFPAMSKIEKFVKYYFIWSCFYWVLLADWKDLISFLHFLGFEEEIECPFIE